MASSFVSRKRCGKLLLSALVVSGAILHAPRLHAAEPEARTSSLSWVRLGEAETCISTQELALAVEARLGRKVFVSAADADVSVEGHIERLGSPPRWQAVLTIRDLHGKVLGTRELESAESDCGALDEPLVLVVSILIDPDAESRAAASEPPALAPPAPLPKAPPPKVVVRRERVLVPAPRERRRPWQLELGLGAAAGIGLLPGTSVGLTSSALLEPPGFWGISVSATYWFPTSVEAEQGATSDVSLAHGGAGLCPLAWRSGQVSNRLCAGAGLGALSSRGEGFDTELSDQKLSAHVFASDRFALRVAGPLALLASLSLIVPLLRTELTYRAADGSSRTLFQPSPIALAADLGLALFFP